MRAFLLLVLILMLPAVPTASAGKVDPAPLHVGDRLLYASHAEETVLDEDGIDRTAYWGRLPWTGDLETLVTVEGRSKATDEYGVLQDTVAFRIERARDDRIVSVERCHMEPSMGWALHWDYLEGGPRSVQEWEFRGRDPLLGQATRYYNSTPVTEFRRNACDGYWELPHRLWGPKIEPGEVVDIRRLTDGFAGIPDLFWFEGSLPGVATSWHGYPAVEYVFPVREINCDPPNACGGPIPMNEGELVLTFADGFPGVVLASVEIVETSPTGEVRTQSGHIELVGYEPGSAPFPYDIAWRDHPDANPNVAFVPHDPLSVGDEAFSLAYPFDLAVRNMRSDPAVGLEDWFASHPSAAVSYANYDVSSDYEFVPFGLPLSGVASDAMKGPGWFACFGDDAATFCASSVIPRAELTAAPANRKELEYEGTSLPQEPFPAISSESAVRIAQEAGVPIDNVRSFSYSSWAYGDNEVAADIIVSEVPWSSLAEMEGQLVRVDLSRGALRSVDSVSVSIASGGGVLSAAAPPRTLVPAKVAGFDALRSLGLAPAVAAATGLALLALVIKLLLIPLYSRLRRDRLLDNPVRARLYERIRAEPGIHLAELEEFLAIGKGATRHHVDQLVQHRLVFLLDDGGYTRAYASGHVPMEAARRAAILRAGSHARVYELYAKHPDASLREAARELGLAAPSVHRAKKKLEKAGLLPAATAVTVAEA